MLLRVFALACCLSLTLAQLCIETRPLHDVATSPLADDNVPLCPHKDTGVQLAGHIYDTNCQPVVGARVTHLRPRGSCYTLTNSDGMYTIETEWQTRRHVLLSVIHDARKRVYAVDMSTEMRTVDLVVPASNAVKREWLKRQWGKTGMQRRDDDSGRRARRDNSIAGVGVAERRGWGSNDLTWLKRTDAARRFLRSNFDDRLRKSSWGDMDMNWIKRSHPEHGMDSVRRKRSVDVADSEKLQTTQHKHDERDMASWKNFDKKPWGDSEMTWIKKDVDKKKWADSGMEWIKKNNDKKNWGDSGMTWIKKDNDKKNWGDSGMTWIKKDNAKKNWGDSGMTWIKKDGDKKNWGDSGMTWIKKDSDNKNWGDSGMMWIKKESDKKNWGDSGMTWIKKESAKKNWGDSGMMWVKKDNAKKNWGDSGMTWIKKDSDKKNWGDSGMTWIKKDNDKKNWGDSGMTWIKKESGKKNWGDSGMTWIKKDNDKKNWGDSGMTWIKKESDKKNWGDSGMTWIKKDNDKKNWGDSGMMWIKKNVGGGFVSPDLSLSKKSAILNSVDAKQMKKADIAGTSSKSVNKKQKWGSSDLTWLRKKSTSNLANAKSEPAASTRIHNKDMAKSES